MFTQGQIVKSKGRTEAHQIFVMVLLDDSPSDTQFKGVVLIDQAQHGLSGEVTNVWNTSHFELSDWQELKAII